ncbi:ABC transporter substrate-binding protein [Dolosigranulum savutiense]|uniref:ABC transporter substrate-binding protein n=1 Tax=Dolosigranulum savutiense TaxID=3110288 RepID=A0AB74THL8_9LACT
MSKLYSFLIGVLGIIVLLMSGSFILQQKTESTTQSDKLVIYNWGDYIDPDLLKKFTQETGIEIQYETFDSNEAMYTKVKQGGTTYDIAVPSDYMIDKMIKDDLLAKLDKSKLVGMEHIGEEFLGKRFDPQNDYSLPYLWGTVGIVYNDQLVDQAPMHWEDLWRPEYENSMMLVDGAREVMGIGLTALGYSVNSKDIDQLHAAEEKLQQLTPNIKAIVADEMKGYMIRGDAAIGVTFSGEASEMIEGNEHLHYIVPSEGSNLWFDNLVLLKNMVHEEEAYAFLNFMNQPENAAQNAEYIGYATPNNTAKALLPDEVKADPAFYPTEDVFAELEIYENLGAEWLEIYNDLYLQIKMYRK